MNAGVSWCSRYARPSARRSAITCIATLIAPLGKMRRWSSSNWTRPAGWTNRCARSCRTSSPRRCRWPCTWRLRGRAPPAPAPTSPTPPMSPRWRRPPTSARRRPCRWANSRFSNHPPAAATATMRKRRRPAAEAGKPGPGVQDEPAAAPANAMGRKVVNDAVAYLRGLAQMRGRNVDWAEQAVRTGASLPAKEALERNVIDLIASYLHSLPTALDGREVRVSGQSRRLDLKDAVIETVEPDWHDRLLAAITHPNIAYMLLLLGFYGLFFELANPGHVLPGVAGAISLLLALYALNVLPVNYAGLALMLIGIA